MAFSSKMKGNHHLQGNAQVAVGQKWVAKMACPGKWNQGLKPAVPCWFNFDPCPNFLPEMAVVDGRDEGGLLRLVGTKAGKGVSFRAAVSLPRSSIAQSQSNNQVKDPMASDDSSMSG